MNNVIRFALLITACAVFLQSGWISYSQDQKCPEMPSAEKRMDMTVMEDFLAAHGLTQEQFSIWLMEHSAWRRQYSDELTEFTFIPQDYDTERK